MLIACGLFLSSLMAWASPLPNPTVELGYQNSFLVGNNPTPFTRALFYAEPAWAPEIKLKERVFETHIKLRGSVDTLSGGFLSELSLRALSVSTSDSHWRLTAGFQEIVWGETFGFPVLDLVSPRDYRDPLLLDANWVRLPTASLNAQVFIDQTTLQLVMTPFSRSPLFPVPGSSIDPTKSMSGVSLSATSGTDLGGIPGGIEWGGKFSHLFGNGIDLGLIYYQHYNRNPVYQLGAGPQGTLLVSPVEKKVDTVGASLSATLDHWVLRADEALHLGQPMQSSTLGTLVSGLQWQSVLGTDVTTDSQWTFGVQLQTTLESFNSGASTTRTFHWASARVNRKFWDGKLEADLFILSGLNNPDLWIQPKLSWYLGDIWSLSLRADWIYYQGGSPSQGYLWLVRDQSRLFLWINAKI